MSRLNDLYQQLADIEEAIEHHVRTLEREAISERERLEVTRAETAARSRSKQARCGTDSGYYRHIRRLREPACDACLTAHRTAESARRRRAIERKRGAA